MRHYFRYFQESATEHYTILNILAIFVGGAIACSLLVPGPEPGPIRVSTYLLFALSSTALAWRHLRVVRTSLDGHANIYLIASCIWWIFFSVAMYFIFYLQAARALGYPSFISVDIQLRISYFFISGSAVGLAFKAFAFSAIPKTELLDRRVSGWPLTISKRRR